MPMYSRCRPSSRWRKLRRHGLTPCGLENRGGVWFRARASGITRSTTWWFRSLQAVHLAHVPDARRVFEARCRLRRLLRLTYPLGRRLRLLPEILQVVLRPGEAI